MIATWDLATSVHPVLHRTPSTRGPDLFPGRNALTLGHDSRACRYFWNMTGDSRARRVPWHKAVQRPIENRSSLPGAIRSRSASARSPRCCSCATDSGHTDGVAEARVLPEDGAWCMPRSHLANGSFGHWPGGLLTADRGSGLATEHGVCRCPVAPPPPGVHLAGWSPHWPPTRAWRKASGRDLRPRAGCLAQGGGDARARVARVGFADGMPVDGRAGLASPPLASSRCSSRPPAPPTAADQDLLSHHGLSMGRHSAGNAPILG